MMKAIGILKLPTNVESSPTESYRTRIKTVTKKPNTQQWEHYQKVIKSGDRQNKSNQHRTDKLQSTRTQVSKTQGVTRLLTSNILLIAKERKGRRLWKVRSINIRQHATATVFRWNLWTLSKFFSKRKRAYSHIRSQGLLLLCAKHDYPQHWHSWTCRDEHGMAAPSFTSRLSQVKK